MGILVVLFTVLGHTLHPKSLPDSCQDNDGGQYLFNRTDGIFSLCHKKDAIIKGELGTFMYKQSPLVTKQGTNTLLYRFVLYVATCLFFGC